MVVYSYLFNREKKERYFGVDLPLTPMVQENQDKELALSKPLEEVDREATKSKTANNPSKIDASFAGAGSYWDQSIPSKRRRSSSNRKDTATTLRESESILSSESFNENKQSENLEKAKKQSQLRTKRKIIKKGKLAPQLTARLQ